MKITPSGNPTASSQPQSSAQSARDRAISMLQTNSPVPNPTNVQPEELTAIAPPQPGESEGQPKPSEATTAPAESEKKQESSEEPLSTQYALLARKEKALRAKVQQQESAYKAKLAELQAKEEALKSKETDYQTNYISKSKLSEDTITTLLEAGVTYDQITQMALNQAQVQVDPQTKLALQRLENQVKAQQEAQDRAVKAQEQAQQQQYQQALNQIRSEARSLINSDPTYETIQATNSINDVVELIERTFKEDGILMSVEEAANDVENHLVEEALKLARIKKVQQKLQPATPAQKQATQQPSQPQSGMKTLTNATSASRPLTVRERAIAAFKGELK